MRALSVLATDILHGLEYEASVVFFQHRLKSPDVFVIQVRLVNEQVRLDKTHVAAEVVQATLPAAPVVRTSAVVSADSVAEGLFKKVRHLGCIDSVLLCAFTHSCVRTFTPIPTHWSAVRMFYHFIHVLSHSRHCAHTLIHNADSPSHARSVTLTPLCPHAHPQCRFAFTSSTSTKLLPRHESSLQRQATNNLITPASKAT